MHAHARAPAGCRARRRRPCCARCAHGLHTAPGLPQSARPRRAGASAAAAAAPTGAAPAATTAPAAAPRRPRRLRTCGGGSRRVAGGAQLCCLAGLVLCWPATDWIAHSAQQPLRRERTFGAQQRVKGVQLLVVGGVAAADGCRPARREACMARTASSRLPAMMLPAWCTALQLHVPACRQSGCRDLVAGGLRTTAGLLCCEFRKDRGGSGRALLARASTIRGDEW